MDIETPAVSAQPVSAQAIPVQPRRRWFQLHLSTAFIILLASGAAMQLFFTPSRIILNGVQMSKLGAPWTAAFKVDRVEKYTQANVDMFGESKVVEAGDYFVSIEAVIKDVVFLIATLCIFACILEVPIWRDEAERVKQLARLHSMAARSSLKRADSPKFDSEPSRGP